MTGQVNLSGNIYDVLGNINLAGHNYLILGKGNDSKLFDVIFVEKKIKNEKVEYVFLDADYENQLRNGVSVGYIQSQMLMDYATNNLKDNMNRGFFSSKESVLKKIDDIVSILNNDKNIMDFFANSNELLKLEEIEHNMDGLYDYYQAKIDPLGKTELINIEEINEAVKRVQANLEDTGDYGVGGLIPKSSMREFEETEIDMPVTIPVNTDNSEEKVIDNSTTFYNPVVNESTTDDVIQPVNTIDEQPAQVTAPVGPVVVDDFTDDNRTAEDIMMLINSGKLNQQQLLYYKNRLEELQKYTRVNNAEENEQSNEMTRGNQKTLNNGHSLLEKTSPLRFNKAAYISISALLYLIGSFELFIAIILIAKYL